MTAIKLHVGTALQFPVELASAVDFPERHEELWERHIQSVVNPGAKRTEITSKICRDHAYDKSVTMTKPQDKSCTFNLVDLGGGKYSSETRCTVQGTVVETKQTFVYQAGTIGPLRDPYD
jgi:hypothetical protein